jgi:hypothetical protein
MMVDSKQIFSVVVLWHSEANDFCSKVRNPPQHVGEQRADDAGRSDGRD